eukprot:5763901-Pyramimonas_sp.AAC.1
MVRRGCGCCSPSLLPMWYFICLSKSHRVFPHFHELDDVAGGGVGLLVLVERAREQLAVAVESVHTREVRRADPDDDDGQRHSGRLHNGVERLVHVHDGAVGDDHQDLVLLAPVLVHRDGVRHHLRLIMG